MANVTASANTIEAAPISRMAVTPCVLGRRLRQWMALMRRSLATLTRKHDEPMSRPFPQVIRQATSFRFERVAVSF